MTFGIIYKFLNKVNGKVYIGQTTGTLEKRLREHKCNAKTCDTLLGKAIRKYGWDCFVVKPIDEALNQIELDQKEIFWISKLKTLGNQNGYNLTEGGWGGKKSEATKKKMSLAQKRKFKENPGLKQYLREINLGNKNALGTIHSDQSKKNMSLAAFNRDNSVYKTKNFKALKARQARGNSSRANVKYKIIFTTGTEKIITNMSKFCKENKLCIDKMHAVASGKYSQHHGLKVKRLGAI